MLILFLYRVPLGSIKALMIKKKPFFASCKLHRPDCLWSVMTASNAYSYGFVKYRKIRPLVSASSIQFHSILFTRHSLKFLLVRIQCDCFVASSLTCSRMILRIASRGICSIDHEATWMCPIFHPNTVSSLLYYNKAKYNMYIISIRISLRSRLSHTAIYYF